MDKYQILQDALGITEDMAGMVEYVALDFVEWLQNQRERGYLLDPTLSEPAFEIYLEQTQSKLKEVAANSLTK